jgi:hypothetical protein
MSDTAYRSAIWRLVVARGAVLLESPGDYWGRKYDWNFYVGEPHWDYGATAQLVSELRDGSRPDLERCSDPASHIESSFTDTESDPAPINFLTGTLVLDTGREFLMGMVIDSRNNDFLGLIRLLTNASDWDGVLASLEKRFFRGNMYC